MKLSAGRELDALVAEKVMGWIRITATSRYYHWHDGSSAQVRHVPRYSTDIAAAWLVVEAAIARGWFPDVLSVVRPPNPISWRCEINYGWYSVRPATTAEAPTAPLAICRAALAALSVPPTVSPTPEVDRG